MGSNISFYRPRGIQRNYTVQISIDLLQTEWVAIFCLRREIHKFHIENNFYGKTEQIDARSETQPQFVITRVITGDKIIVEMHDRFVEPIQCTVYTAIDNGFTEEALSYMTRGNKWEPHETHFHPIELIDMDKIGSYRVIIANDLMPQIMKSA